jgi:hypothetical protein
MKNFLFQGGGKGFKSRLILLGPIPHGAAINMARKVIDRKIATLASLMRVGSWLTFLWNFRYEAKAFSLEQQKNAFLQESRDKNSSKSKKQLDLLRL